jgi:dolichyl-phosphate beta-glucosyltransferase
MNAGTRELSVVIPAYNEDANIGPTLKKVIYFLNNEGFDSEVIVVNDGSIDRTREIILGFPEVKIIENKTNLGKGYSVKKGILSASKENILFLDADSATPIEEVLKALSFIDSFPLVIGSRNLMGSQIITDQPLYRRFMGKTFSYLVRVFSDLDVKDSQCGFKLFKRKEANHIFLKTTVHGWCFDVEVLFIARKKGFAVKEIPIVWFDHTSTSKIKPLKSSLEMLRDLLRIRVNDWRGRYE